MRRGAGRAVYASLVRAGGQFYAVTRRGGVFVFPTGPKYEAAARSAPMDDNPFNATPAADDGQLFLRSEKFLYCFQGGREGPMMYRILGSLGVLGAFVVAALALRPPGDSKGPPKGYKLGKLMPPHVIEGLDLTDEQRKQLHALEEEVRGKLGKILTDEQIRAAEKLGKRPPGPPDGGKKGGPPPRDDDDRDLPKRPEPEARLKAEGGIAWFTSLDTGLKEAKRSGRPILFVSAAPHCAGVSGIW